jgi:hypothetical protein
MTVEKQFPSGAWLISDIVRGSLFTRRYMGYTKRQAITLFKAEVKRPQ